MRRWKTNQACQSIKQCSFCVTKRLAGKPPLSPNQQRRSNSQSTLYVPTRHLERLTHKKDFKSPHVLDAIKYYPGKYVLTLYAGSFDTPNSVSYQVGTIKLALPGPKQPGHIPPGISRVGKAGPGAPDPKEFHVQPEIKHVFRQPEKHAPAVVSNVFALATLAPWLVLLFGVRLLSPTAQRD